MWSLSLREWNQQLQTKISELTGDENLESLLNLKLRCLTQDHQAMKKKHNDLMLAHSQCDRVTVERNTLISELRDDILDFKKKLQTAQDDLKAERVKNERLVRESESTFPPLPTLHSPLSPHHMSTNHFALSMTTDLFPE